MWTIRAWFLLMFVASGCLGARNINIQWNVDIDNRTIVINIYNKFITQVVGGDSNQKGRYSSSAQLISVVPHNSSSGSIQYCGGSVISEQHILTAAHCVDGASGVDVKMDTDIGSGEPKTYSVKNVHIHGGFNRTSLENDIALIQLNESITFTPKFQPVKLGCTYTPPNTQTEAATNALTFVTENHVSAAQDYSNLTTISNEECSKQLPHVVPTKICAQNADNRATCHSDGGTAMILTVDGNNVQVAVASSPHDAAASCELGVPHSYTRISSYTDWIDEMAAVPCIPIADANNKTEME